MVYKVKYAKLHLIFILKMVINTNFLIPIKNNFALKQNLLISDSLNSLIGHDNKNNFLAQLFNESSNYTIRKNFVE